MVKAGYKETEIGVIPAEWEVKSFVDVGDFFKGSGISMRDVVFSGYPCIMYGDIYVKYDTHFEKCDYRITAQTAANSTRAKRGDLFFTASGETAEEIGKCVSYQGIDDIFIGGDIIAVRPSLNYDSLFLAYVQNSAALIKQKASFAQGCSVVHISGENIKKLVFASPELPEQRRIAEALSDIDTLIANLEKLIAKKKAIKQGTMQLLLTGKKRLPGFAGEWGDTNLGEAGMLLRDSVNPQGNPDRFFSEYSMPSYDLGRTPNRVPGSTMHSNRIKICGPVLLFNKLNVRQKRVWFVDSCEDSAVCSTEFLPYCSTKINLLLLSYYLLSDSTTAYFERISAGTSNSQKRITPDNFKEYSLYIPKDFDEQTAIATALSDMDSEIAELETKLSKYRNIKTGMMQALLTGKIRLTEQATPAVVVPLPTTEAQAMPEAKLHNRQFDDAVAIAAIVNAFYSDKYPLGRKKVQKLLYLLRRKQAASTAAFKKKAAGPYADEVRYKGGEPIAKRNGYVTVESSNQGSKFAKGKSIGKALGYIVKWDMQPDIDWLVSQFIRTPVNRLELLATIDMAMCDLEGNGITASVDSVKELIASDKEWRAKLEKTYFSDDDIGWAITECLGLFNTTGR